MKLGKKEFFSKGKRGFIYTASYKGKKIAIKKKNPESKAIKRIRNEAYWLKQLNKLGIGAKFLFFEKGSLGYKFVEGVFIDDFIKCSNKRTIVKVLKDIFEQMFLLDKLGVNKEEMHHPRKHILITKKNKPILIDFERCHKTEKPKNVTQFVQFVCSTNTLNLLKSKNIKVKKDLMRKSAGIYKKERTKKNLDKILCLLT